MMFSEELVRMILVRFLMVNRKINFRVYSIGGFYLIVFLWSVVS